jgi:hypothetical protein
MRAARARVRRATSRPMRRSLRVRVRVRDRREAKRFCSTHRAAVAVPMFRARLGRGATRVRWVTFARRRE